MCPLWTGSEGLRSAVVVATLLAIAGVARAGDDDEAARRFFRAGVEAAQANRWPDALAAFTEAHRRAPRPLVLLNLAGAQLKTGRLVAAETSYRRFLAETLPGELPSERQAATRVLEELAHKIPRVQIDLKGVRPDSDVRIDGQPIGHDRLGDLPVDPGDHELTVTRVGRVQVRSAFALKESEVRVLTADLSSPPPAVSPALRLESTAPPPSAKRGVLASPWFWGATGAVLVAAATALLLVRQQPSAFHGNVDPGRVGVR